MSEPVTYPGAHRPVRDYTVDAGGVGIAVHEWGDEAADPLFLVHGGFDFAGTYDVFAPRLAEHGWRVIAWDQRGHGDSAHTQLYSWEADLRDALAVFSSVTDQPVPVVGHSKGGALMIQLADAHPYRFSHIVNLDGIPFRRPIPDVSDHERTRLLSDEVAGWLDHRRRTAELTRKPGTLDELAERRARMNPRLEHGWLRYLVSVGARHDDDGWRWKIDPSLRFGGFGPWRPEWSMLRLPALQMPFLGILATEIEMMGWGTTADDVRPFLPLRGRVEALDGAGHFVHIEQPDQVFEMVVEFLEEGR